MTKLTVEELERQIVITPIQEDKYPTGRAIAAAYWISYFALHWLLTLEVIELTTTHAATTLYFLLSAIIVTMAIAAHELAIAKEKKE